MNAFSQSFAAFFGREWSAGRANRSLIAFPLAMLAAGALPPILGHVQETAQLYLLQALLYLVPLFAMVIGVSAAHADAPENALLGSLPTSVTGRVAGKFAALLGLFGLAQTALLLPSLIAGAGLAALLRLWGYGLGAGAAFLAIGLLVGFRSADGVRAQLTGLAIWLFVTFGFGLVAWLLAASGWASRSPGLWLLLLGSSPLEALRVGVLFRVQALPFSPDAIAPLGRLWLDRPGLWFAVVSTIWALVALALARPRRG